MAWNYAELSKAAKEAGGPETFVESKQSHSLFWKSKNSMRNTRMTMTV